MNNSTTRFSDRASNYVRYRPSYPKEAITYIFSEFGIQSNAVVADIGSGTGIFTELLLPLVETVFAVEPNTEMREAAVARLHKNSRFQSINGSSESSKLGDKSLDFIFSAQAAHWFDLPETKKEFRRILKPNGTVVFIWNKRQINSEFLQEYEALLQSIPDYLEVTHNNLTEDALKEFLGYRYKKKTFANSQTFDLDGLLGRFSSSSYAPKEGTADYFEVKKKLEYIFSKTSVEGEVSFNYITEVYSGRIS